VEDGGDGQSHEYRCQDIAENFHSLPQ
jgi:hypothetical protein